MTSPLFDEFDVLDTVISSIAILSNPDWTDKRETPQVALDEIHSLTSAVIGGVMKRIAERTATDRHPHSDTPSADDIPSGPYCYTSLGAMDSAGHMRVKGPCPHWQDREGDNAYCAYLNYETEFERELLWDQVKICGVRHD